MTEMTAYDERRGTREDHAKWLARRARDQSAASTARAAMNDYVKAHGTLPNRSQLAAFMQAHAQ